VPIDPSSLVAEITRRERELDALRHELSAFRRPALRGIGELSVVRCRLGDRAVAFRSSELDEVVMMAALTPLPEAPPWVMGMLQVGPDHLPVLDLVARETGHRRRPHPDQFILLARNSEARLGMVVDALEGLANIDAREVHPPPAEIPFAAHALGIADISDRPTVLLAVQAIPIVTLESPP